MSDTEIRDLDRRLSEIKGMLQGIQSSMKRIESDGSRYQGILQGLLIWQAQVDQRLATGQKSFKEIRESMVEKKILIAYALGVASASSGATLLLARLFGM